MTESLSRLKLWQMYELRRDDEGSNSDGIAFAIETRFYSEALTDRKIKLQQ